MLDLKPCPFCGGAAHYSETVFNKCYIACRTCGARSAESYISADYCVKDRLAEEWNKRAEPEEQINTVYGYDAKQLVLFAECCREVGITNDDLKNVGDCCRLAIDATEKAMVESFKKSYERFEIWKN